MSWRELAPYYLFVLACLTVSPYLGLDSFEVDPRISEIWPPGVGGFVLLTVIWYVSRRAVVVTLAPPDVNLLFGYLYPNLLRNQIAIFPGASTLGIFELARFQALVVESLA